MLFVISDIFIWFWAGISGLICLESDNESERGSASKVWKQNESAFVGCELAKDSKLGSRFVDSPFHLGKLLLYFDNYAI